MKNQNSPFAQTYLDNLFDILANVEVTDGIKEHLSLDEAAQELTLILFGIKANSGKVFLIGNGGSSAIAGHTQNDLCAAVGVRAMTCTDMPLLTALSNDQGYDQAFERQIELWANTGDLLIAISSSGESVNILLATKAAIARGCRVITFTGFQPENKLRQLGDVNFYVPAESYGHVELAHSVITHFLTDWACSRQHLLSTFSTNIHTVDARLRQTEV